MKYTLNTRIPVDKIRPEHLQQYPIWEFALGEEDHPDRDETWIRPIQELLIGMESYSLIAAANFTLSCNLNVFGFMMVNTVDNVVEILPGAIVSFKNYVFIPSELFMNEGSSAYDFKYMENAIEMSLKEVYPIKWSLRVAILGESDLRTGILN